MIALDGKTRRHCFDTATGPKAIHLVSAWVSHHRLVLGQVKVDEKSNEITALPVFFAWLDIGGCILTSEARGCQTAIAKPIVEQKGDYLLALKGHPESIHQLSPLHPFTPSFRAALPPGDFLEGA